MSKFVNFTLIVGTREDDLENTTPVTSPVTVNTAFVREFYPRKNGETGTRLSMSNGSGLAVNESYATVYEAITGEVLPTSEQEPATVVGLDEEAGTEAVN